MLGTSWLQVYLWSVVNRFATELTPIRILRGGQHALRMNRIITLGRQTVTCRQRRCAQGHRYSRLRERPRGWVTIVRQWIHGGRRGGVRGTVLIAIRDGVQLLLLLFTADQFKHGRSEESGLQFPPRNLAHFTLMIFDHPDDFIFVIQYLEVEWCYCSCGVSKYNCLAYLYQTAHLFM